MEPIDLKARRFVGRCVAVISRRKQLRSVGSGRHGPDTLISYNTIQAGVCIIGKNLKSQSWNLTIPHMRKSALGTQQRDRMEPLWSRCTSCSGDVTAECTQVRNLRTLSSCYPQGRSLRGDCPKLTGCRGGQLTPSRATLGSSRWYPGRIGGHVRNDLRRERLGEGEYGSIE